MRRRWWILLLSVLLLHGFFTNLHHKMVTSFWSEISSVKVPKINCAMARDIILQTPLSRMSAFSFRRYVNILQNCTWGYNESECNQLKSEFRECCKAAQTLLVTKENAPRGHRLTYETNQKRWFVVTDKVHSMFPKQSPFIGKQFKTCAVVGNGGILLNSSCGVEIDGMDYVFRFNLPPLYVKDTGAKSNIVSANPSILVKKFKNLLEKRKPFIDLVKVYGSAMILLPAFSYVHNTDISFRVQHSLEDFNVSNRVVFFHPDYLKNLFTYWKKMGLLAKRMTSGLMLVSAAIELCEQVTLYGFWPFAEDPEGNRVPHHYYDDIYPKPGFHSMPDEFYFYTKLHLKGALYLKVGKC